MKPRVLVVEDDELSQGYLKRLLKREFEVSCAASAAEARAHLTDDSPDVAVVLMDLSLKGDEDGLMLTRWLCAHPRWKNVPIIATTAFAQPEDRRAALGAGCKLYLAKPFTSQELRGAIATALGRDPS